MYKFMIRFAVFSLSSFMITVVADLTVTSKGEISYEINRPPQMQMYLRKESNLQIQV